MKIKIPDNPKAFYSLIPIEPKENTKKYKTILADPPWKYGVWGKGTKEACSKKKFNWRDTPMPYNTMSVDEIKALPVASLANDNCELYLWATQKYLPDSFEVMAAWGFRYCQILIWCKKPRGKGQGGVYCPTTEFLLLGRKGKMPKIERVDTTWWQIKRQSKHSKKPKFFQDLIESVTNFPRIELFARENNPGWDVWGNEVDSDIVL